MARRLSGGDEEGGESAADVNRKLEVRPCVEASFVLGVESFLALLPGTAERAAPAGGLAS